MIRVVKYNKNYKEEWDKFVLEGKNSTFLFRRNFMEYHSMRFLDYSLIVFDDEKVISLLPANIKSNDQIISHEGLTYGGFVFNDAVKLESVIKIIYHVLEYLYNQGIKSVILKQFPFFYNRRTTQEVEYALFLLDSLLVRRDVAFVVDLRDRIPYSGNVRREGNKASKLDAIIREDDTFDSFWENILVPGLHEKHGVKPVHSLEEIKYLKSQFPGEIKQFNVYLEDEVVAGATMFLTPLVAHCQYISSNEKGKRSGALNFLFKYFLDDYFSEMKYFDFGIANENNGRDINRGLLFWKESFGGRAYTHDFYLIDCASFKNLDKFIL